MPHVDDWSLIGVPGFEKRWEVLSELIALWWTVIVGFQSVSIRLSSIVRQRIGIDRTLVISIIKYLVTIIRLKKGRDFSIAGGAVKKSLDGIAKYPKSSFLPRLSVYYVCHLWKESVLTLNIWRFFGVSVRYSVVFFYTGKKCLVCFQ